MNTTVSDHLLERLRAWGVRRIYGYPGDGINGLMGALDRQGEAMRFIQARHEELAAFMATAHAKFSGEVGVCMATSGPGAIHLLNGLYDAKADHQPVVAIVGQQARAALGGDYQQEVDLVSLFKDVADAYVHMATVPAQIRHLVDRAVRIALDQRTVTCLIVPNDLQEMPAEQTPPREHGTVHSGIGRTFRPQAPAEDDLRAAADVLNAGRKVAILAGAGALHATDELIAVADRLGAGVAKALLGKFAVPDDLPFVTGAIGLLGTVPSWDLMSGCDTRDPRAAAQRPARTRRWPPGLRGAWDCPRSSPGARPPCPPARRAHGRHAPRRSRNTAAHPPPGPRASRRRARWCRAAARCSRRQDASGSATGSASGAGAGGMAVICPGGC
jgi:pyruvate dehydrogenase (quinone)